MPPRARVTTAGAKGGLSTSARRTLLPRCADRQQCERPGTSHGDFVYSVTMVFEIGVPTGKSLTWANICAQSVQ